MMEEAARETRRVVSMLSFRWHFVPKSFRAIAAVSSGQDIAPGRTCDSAGLQLGLGLVLVPPIDSDA